MSHGDDSSLGAWSNLRGNAAGRGKGGEGAGGLRGDAAGG